MTDSPAAFIDTLQRHVEGNYEAEHPAEMTQTIELTRQCNPDRSYKWPRSYSKDFNICMDLKSWSVWGGNGQISVLNTDLKGRSLSLTGDAAFIGGQYIWHRSLSSNVVLEGKYWYLPQFKTDDELGKETRTSIWTDTVTAYQSRISFSSWSWRLGGALQSIPIPRNESDSEAAEDIDVKFNNTYIGGALLGIKWVPDRPGGGTYFFNADLVTLNYTDGTLFKAPDESYSFRVGMRYFITNRWSALFETKYQNFYNAHDDNITSFNWALGIEGFIF